MVGSSMEIITRLRGEWIVPCFLILRDINIRVDK